MLAQPQERLDLQQRQTRAVAATCMAFPQPQSDINNFVVGSEEGVVYSGAPPWLPFGLLMELLIGLFPFFGSQSPRAEGRHRRDVRRPPGSDPRPRLPQFARTHRLFAPVPHLVRRLDRQTVESQGAPVETERCVFVSGTRLGQGRRPDLRSIVYSLLH